MATDICGFVEISGLDEQDLAEEYAWRASIDLESLELFTGDESSILFGWPAIEAPAAWRPVAAARGLPPNPSPHTRQRLAEASRWKEEGIMELWGITHVAYQEIEAWDWSGYRGARVANLQEGHGWGLLMKLLALLDASGKSVRLIAWFERR